ncbi:hypothetical protein M408DRAFT_17753 [Serendipita vermifera MAFF 305830]|uniref:Amine oxidase domain-containing protein n=1 Tax=Serendipita vermifera MAFF 305830 TaxID=933852 RepID=A0A0C2WC15_SERVB|nr:hypothetical protein M408DRAFT_17753 [Serendipita vermifera MAFF 305830]
MLDDLGIPYHIHEARDRVGGRLFTYKFPGDSGSDPNYNYYDVGAMRFPKIAPMARLFHLFDYKPLNPEEDPLNKRLTPYIFGKKTEEDYTFRYYNGLRYRRKDVPATGDPFNAQAVILDTQDKDPYITAGYKNIMDDVIGPFVELLMKDDPLQEPLQKDEPKNGQKQDNVPKNGQKGFNHLMKFDGYSTRSYMTTRYKPSPELREKYNLPNAHLPTDVVNWMETFDKSTGWYDRALSETVLEAIAFGWPDPSSVKWYCLKGGAQYLAEAMAKYISKRQTGAFTFNSRVTKIALSEDQELLEVVASNKTYKYPYVVSSIPLPVLRTIDLTRAKFTPMQSSALRELNYGPSIKIGMQFQTAWWTTGIDRDGNRLSIVGGQSYTDRPLRTVVYPSFPSVQDVEKGNTTTLIASYCWTDDASRMGALIDKDKEFLVDLVLRELSEVHNVDLDFLTGQLMATHAWSWSHDPYTMGAFAFFGPGKFKSPYVSLNAPAAAERLYLASEAISIRHAWVEGALDSAWVSVAQLLFRMARKHEIPEDLLTKFQKNWPRNPEWLSDSSSSGLERHTKQKGEEDLFKDESLLRQHFVLAHNLAKKHE